MMVGLVLITSTKKKLKKLLFFIAEKGLTKVHKCDIMELTDSDREPQVRKFCENIHKQKNSSASCEKIHK